MASNICPKCGSTNIDLQLVQENAGTTTITKTKSKYKQKKHGILWWLLIGWWWWIIDLFIWIYAFPIRFLVQLFKKKKYVGKSKSVSVSKNNVNYKSVCLCKDCGYHWVAYRS